MALHIQPRVGTPGPDRLLLLCVVHAKRHCSKPAVPASPEKSEGHPSRRHRQTLNDLIPISSFSRKVLCLLPLCQEEEMGPKVEKHITTISNDLDLIIGSELNGKRTIENYVSVPLQTEPGLGLPLNLTSSEQRHPVSLAARLRKGETAGSVRRGRPAQCSLLASIGGPALPALVIALLLVARHDVVDPQQQHRSLGRKRSRRSARRGGRLPSATAPSPQALSCLNAQCSPPEARSAAHAVPRFT